MGRPPKIRDPEVNQEQAAELLELYGFSDLPDVFAMRDGESIVQEREACYLCQADCFLGKGTSGTWYQEGSIIVTDTVPNIHMQPLNRAAGLAHAQWQASLPDDNVPIDIGDLSEAAHMLAKDPEVTNLSPLKYQEAVRKVALGLKTKRDGKDARSLPSIGHNFTPQSGGKAPPILGAKMSDMSQRGPGFTHAQPTAAHPADVRRAMPLGGAPPR